MSLSSDLARHRGSEPKEEQDRLRMLDFANRHQHPFDRSIEEGHFTGSGLVMSEDGSSVLLLFHRKLQRWLQPGGHGESGESRGEEVAAREVREETGLEPRLHPTAARPFDVDIHVIPARHRDPEHEHLDLRYLFVAQRSEAIRAETHVDATEGGEAPLRWIDVGEALSMDLDPGLKRMIRKASVWLASS